MKKQDKIHKFDRPPLVLKKQYTRPNSMTILEAPSRMANTLFYPDGRVVYDKAQNKDS